MTTYKLYTVPWSLHCREAESLLKKTVVSVEKIELSRWDLFAAAPRDIGIHRLPVLEGKDVLYEGLFGIKKFVEER